MPDHTERKQDTRFKPGQSGNPAGRPKGARSRFSEAFLADFLAAWEEHGKVLLDRVANEQPGIFLRVAAQIVPKELNVDMERRSRPVEELTDDELTAIIRDSQERLRELDAENSAGSKH